MRSIGSILVKSIRNFTTITALNTFKQTLVKPSLFNKSLYCFSQSNPHVNHTHNNHNKQDPVKAIQTQLHKFFKESQSKHPNDPEQVIKQMYLKCQSFLTQNKRLQILIMYEFIAQFIKLNCLEQKYSAFLVISAQNSFYMGKYEQVEKKARLALPYQIKRHGQNHQQIGGIYNMIGISISKTKGRGQQALQYLSKALKIRKQAFGQSMQAAQVLFNIGIVNEQSLNIPQKAQLNYLDSIQMLQNSKIPDPLLYIKVKMRLSQIQFKLHKKSTKYTTDLLRLQQTVQKFKTQQKFSSSMMANVDMILSLLYRNLGRQFLEDKQFAKSIKYNQLCLNYLRFNKMETQDRIKVLEACALAYVGMQQKQKAVELLEQAGKILQNYPTTDQYKFQFYRFLTHSYRELKNYKQQQQYLQKLLNLVKNTKQSFVKPLYAKQIQMSLLYCLGNANQFKLVLERGNKFLELLDKEKSTTSNQEYLDFKYHTLSYIGYAYSSNVFNQFDQALKYLIQASQVNNQLPVTLPRYQFKNTLLKKIGAIYLHGKHDYVKAYEYLNKYKQSILNHPSMHILQRINNLVVLLIQFSLQPPAPGNQKAFTEKLIQGKYVENINSLLLLVTKLIKQVSIQTNTPQSISQYFILVDAIYKMINGFKQMQNYPNQHTLIQQSKNILKELISVYEKLYEKQFKQVGENTFQGDQYLGHLISMSEQIKIQFGIVNVKKIDDWK